MPRQRRGGYASNSVMARLVTKAVRVTPRLGTHTIVLIAVVSVVLASAYTRATPQIVVASVAADSPDSRQALPAQRALDIDARTALPRAVSATQGTDQRQSLAFNPRQGLPQWLRAIKDAPLWSGADATATSALSLPAGITF